MSKLRIQAARTFALEMVRASLWHDSIPCEYRLTGMWMHMDMEMGDGRYKSVAIQIKIHGAPCQVGSESQVFSEDGVWVRGTCRIYLVEQPDKTWQFDCRIEDDHIIATPATAP